jgi:hypothetical protein
MIVDTREQLDGLRSGLIIGAVVDDENRFAIFIGQAIEDEKDPPGQSQDQFTPIVPNALEQLVGGIFSERQFRIEDDAAVIILARKRQREDGLCQSANAVAMSLTDPTVMKQFTDAESIEERINLSVSMNVGLRLGGKLAMVNLSPFLLILL